MVGAAVLAIPLFWVPGTTQAAVGAPVAEIMNPENSKIFRPGDVPLVDGNAFAGLGVNAVKLEFWLANKMERVVLANCGACKTSSATYWKYSAEGLLPGYYLVRAYAVDNSGNFSPAAQRGFVYGLQTINTPKTPDTPSVPVSPPGTIPAPTIDQPPNVALPGAEGPVTIGGSTSRPGQNVAVRETSIGPMGTVASGDDGTWSFTTRLPSGNYKFRVKATDEHGGRSSWSRIYRISVDADRPILGVATAPDTAFLPTDPVVIEGTLFDNRAPGRVRVEYWMLNNVVLVKNALVSLEDGQRAIWESRPTELQPGYYYVRISAYDKAGNPSHNATTSFLYAI